MSTAKLADQVPQASSGVVAKPDSSKHVKYACRVRDLQKTMCSRGETVRALRGVSFDVPEGDYVAIWDLRIWQKYTPEPPWMPGYPKRWFFVLGRRRRRSDE